MFKGHFGAKAGFNENFLPSKVTVPKNKIRDSVINEITRIR